MTKTEKPNSEEKPAGRMSSPGRSPGGTPSPLWFVVIAVPIVLGLVMSGLQGRSSGAQPESAAPLVVAESGTTQGQGRGEDAGRAAARLRGQAGTDGEIMPFPADSCAFEEWVGQTMTTEIEDALKTQGRMVRILAPGASMTMDHSPQRVNLEVDGTGTIARIWCG